MSEGNELVRLIRPRALPATKMIVEANEAECAALAKRFGVTAIHSLGAEVDFVNRDEAVLVDGILTATIEQPCAVTRESLTYEVTEPFSLRFVPAGQTPEYEEDEEFELTEEELDEVEYEGDSFDLGEAIAQTLGLAIDPYREGPDADAVRKETGIQSDEASQPSGPLAEALAALKKG